MDWILNLLSPGSTSLAATIVLYSFIIAMGIFLGKLRIGGISLGVTFVLFVGIIMGHFGYTVDHDILHFIREFGLILFIFSIGIQVGPAFFSSFKQGGVQLNVLAALGILLNVAMVLAIYYIDGDTSIEALVGVMSGAVTNTPGLAAAQQAVENPLSADIMAMGYAAAYPLGVIGIILSILLIKVVFRIKTDREVKLMEAEAERSQLKPHIVTFEITNLLIDGKNLKQIGNIVSCNFVISRLMHADGTIIIPKSETAVSIGDKLLVVMSQQDEEKLQPLFGPIVQMDWEAVQSPLVVRRILVTQSKVNGAKIGSLRLRMGYRLNVTRINRAGVELLASPNLRLQVGDKLTVVGKEEDINRLAEKLGDSMKRLKEPNMITIFVGVMLGIILGSVPFGFGMKLGLAGGPLVVAILLSRFGYKFKLVTYTSTSASLLMRELGICLFLASVGISSGANFVETVFNPTGMMWVLWGFLITVVPLLIVGSIARGLLKINYLTIMGLMSGGYTDPPALAYSNNSTGNDAPAIAYSTVYPLTMFLRVVAAQFLILLFA